MKGLSNFVPWFFCSARLPCTHAHVAGPQRRQRERLHDGVVRGGVEGRKHGGRGAVTVRAAATDRRRRVCRREQARAGLLHAGRMLRLLQGDVGSGKTVVSLLAMLGAVEAGLQAALMAPTELLVRQHLASLEPYAKAAGARLGCLTGREKGAGRDAILAKLAAGEIVVLDVEGFPLRRRWFAVHRRSKHLTNAAQGFLDFLKEENRTDPLAKVFG